MLAKRHTACLRRSKMPFEQGLAPREASQTAHEPLSSSPSAALCPTLLYSSTKDVLQAKANSREGESWLTTKTV